MKLKSKLKYYFYKSFQRYYIKFFNKAFDHKLNYNLLELIKRGLKIDVIFDIGAHKGNWSKTLYETSLKGKNFYLFEANRLSFIQNKSFHTVRFNRIFNNVNDFSKRDFHLYLTSIDSTLFSYSFYHTRFK